MTSLLGQLWLSADLIVSAIHSWELKAGTRIETKGLIRSMEKLRQLPTSDVRPILCPFGVSLSHSDNRPNFETSATAPSGAWAHCPIPSAAGASGRNRLT